MHPVKRQIDITSVSSATMSNISCSSIRSQAGIRKHIFETVFHHIAELFKVVTSLSFLKQSTPHLFSAKFLARQFSLFLILGLLVGCQEALYSDLQVRDVNEMAAVLESNNISAKRRSDGDGKYSLMIAGDDFAEAVKLLTANGLPRKSYKGIGEVFQKEGLVSTPFEEKARYVFAMSQELSESLSRIAGITDARVHVMAPDKYGSKFKKETVKASVIIYHDPTVSMSDTIPRIKQFLSHSIPGLTYDNVAVAMFPSTSVLGSQSKSSFLNPFEPKAETDSGTNSNLGYFIILIVVVFIVLLLIQSTLRRPRWN